MTHHARWHVLGAGAMGCLLVERLLAAGQSATLLHHRDAHGRREIVTGDRRRTLCADTLQSLPRASIRRLVLTTKAGQLVPALETARPWLAADAVLLTLANGLGFEAAVARQLPGTPLHRAVSTAAAYRDAAGTVHAVATGQTRVGTPGRNAAPPAWFVDSLAHLEGWTWARNIDTALGEKFSLNCAINALTAVRRCRNGELLDGDAPGAELAALCAEAEPALRALGLWQRAEALLPAAATVCRSTAMNRSSMLQDVLAGRPTEIAFLNGELLRRAEALDMMLPLNRELVMELTRAVAQRSSP